ncbi:MAG TPA: HIT family protein [Acidimicrobiales bacterium]|jgi:histidine triad (HIT) family protein
MASVFTMIIEGQIPGEFVWRDDRCVAFLSINPLHDGHTLVVPRDEVDHWVDLDDDLAAHLFVVARKIGKVQQDLFDPLRVGLMIVGEEVPHAHLHVVPIDRVADLDFANAAPGPGDDFAEIAQRLRAALAAAGHDEATA